MVRIAARIENIQRGRMPLDPPTGLGSALNVFNTPAGGYVYMCSTNCFWKLGQYVHRSFAQGAPSNP